MKYELNDVLTVLNKEHIRATYGAVGKLIHMSAQSVGVALGDRRSEASWVVAKVNGRPTGYTPAELHRQLFASRRVIFRGVDLLKLMESCHEV